MRRRAAAIGFLAAAVAALSAQSTGRPTPLQAGDIVITGGQLFDSVRDTVVPNTGIVVRNGVLLEVGATLTAAISARRRWSDSARMSTCCPGLFDLHAHYAVDCSARDASTSTPPTRWSFSATA